MSSLAPGSEESVGIFWNGVLAGVLRRTPRGSAFEYDRGFLNYPAKPPNGIAVHLAYTDQPIRTTGVNLHPFFAGLLPEGLRLEAIVHRARTSRDDLLSLFIEAGSDCVGDVFPASTQTPDTKTQAYDLSALQRASFTEAERQYLEGAREAAVPGVQPKLSGALLNLPVLTTRGAVPSILKVSPTAYPRLVENEHFFLSLAKNCGLRVPRHRLVSDRDGRTALVVERFDRVRDKELGGFRRIHQEDACQLLNLYPSEKYRVSLREVAAAIAKVSLAPKVEMARLCELVAYCYLIGNADLHAKNVSVVWNPATRGFELTPAYDLVCTAAFPRLVTRMALLMDGKDDNFKRADFATFFGRHGLSAGVVETILDRLAKGIAPALEKVGEIGYDAATTKRMLTLIEKRLGELG